MRFFRALAFGLAEMTYDEFRSLTLKKFFRIIKAKSDWNELSAGKNPFATAESRQRDKDKLLEIAKQRGIL